MSKVFAIGEALIDFLPDRKGVGLSGVENFKKSPGGAPANVSAAVAKLSGESVFLGKVGDDPFGEFLTETLKDAGVDTRYMRKTGEAKTALAFVSLKADGDRDFMFYRNPSADMLLDESEIDGDIFKSGDILHFCSVSLVDAPVKRAHLKAIREAKKRGAIISFDPNLRFPLWPSKEALLKTVKEFLPLADIIKISDEEIEFITGSSDPAVGARALGEANDALVIYTKGGEGAEAYAACGHAAGRGFKVKVQDTTGAGDAFIGAFLFMTAKNGLPENTAQIKEFLDFASAAAAISVTRPGAIESLASYDEVERFLCGK